MKKINVLRTLLVTFIMMIAASSFAFAGTQDFVFHNRSNRSVDALYVSYAGEKDWGGDILGRDVLYSGESTGTGFNGYTEKTWDMFVIDEYGNEIECYNFKLNYVNNVYFDGETFWYD